MAGIEARTRRSKFPRRVKSGISWSTRKHANVSDLRFVSPQSDGNLAIGMNAAKWMNVSEDMWSNMPSGRPTIGLENLLSMCLSINSTQKRSGRQHQLYTQTSVRCLQELELLEFTEPVRKRLRVRVLQRSSRANTAVSV